MSEQSSGEWKVTDPSRVAAGLHGITYHATKAEAEERAEMFPGSVVEFVASAAS
jgi:hypothetical protein